MPIIIVRLSSSLERRMPSCSCQTFFCIVVYITKEMNVGSSSVLSLELAGKPWPQYCCFLKDYTGQSKHHDRVSANAIFVKMMQNRIKK